MTLAFLLLAAAAAVTDWMAVARQQRRLELAAKPLTLALLIVAAASADMGHAKAWVVVALAFALLGDIALMFSSDGPADAAFVTGLAAFLVGHVAYIVAFTRHGLHPAQVVAGLLVVAGTSVLLAPRVLRGARQHGGSELAVAVGAYAGVLSVMVILAFGTAAIATAVGAALFLVSDSTLAWNRFVQPLLRGRIVVIVTYHLAQVLIVAGLIR